MNTRGRTNGECRIAQHEGPSANGLSLYERAMGERYGALPVAVQTFHRLAGVIVLHGSVTVDAPASMPARLFAWALGSPRRAGHGALRFELDAGPDLETWTRCFPSHTMRSRLRLADGHVVERLGPVRLTFDLLAHADRLEMRLQSLHMMGVPCPAWLRPVVIAEERGEGDRLHFVVSASLPFVGRVASYHGHLDIAPKVSA